MKNEASMKPFPNNLFDDLEVEAPNELAEDFFPTLMYILRCICNPRDSRAVLMRYKDGKSYEEIGETLGLSKQRAHYMLQEILCKFNKEYLTMLTKGIKQYYEDLLAERISALGTVIEDSEREIIKMDSFEEGYNKGYADGSEMLAKKKGSNSVTNGIPLNMLSLSVRTYNALTKSGYKTLGEVIDLGDKLMDITSFGKTCFHELCKIFENYGINAMNTFPKCAKKWGIG